MIVRVFSDSYLTLAMIFVGCLTELQGHANFLASDSSYCFSVKAAYVRIATPAQLALAMFAGEHCGHRGCGLLPGGVVSSAAGGDQFRGVGNGCARTA